MENIRNYERKSNKKLEKIMQLNQCHCNPFKQRNRDNSHSSKPIFFSEFSVFCLQTSLWGEALPFCLSRILPCWNLMPDSFHESFSFFFSFLNHACLLFLYFKSWFALTCNPWTKKKDRHLLFACSRSANLTLTLSVWSPGHLLTHAKLS